MAKKDFSQTNTSRVYAAIQEAAAAPLDDFDAQRLAELQGEQKTVDGQESDYAQERTRDVRRRHPKAFDEPEPEKMQPEPKKPVKEKKIAISVFLTPSSYDAIKRLAHYRQSSAGSLIDEIIKEYLDASKDELDAFDAFTKKMQAKRKK